MKRTVLFLATGLSLVLAGLVMAQTQDPSAAQQPSTSTQSSSTTDPAATTTQTDPATTTDPSSSGSLPATASPLPLVALTGLAALALGLSLSRRKAKD